MDVREPLSSAQVLALRERLMEIRDGLIASLEDRGATAAPVDLDEPIGRLSRMEAIQQQQMAQAARGRSAIRLKQVQAAVERIKTDDYGYCVSCDEPIGEARLQARPETPLCLACQSDLESP